MMKGIALPSSPRGYSHCCRGIVDFYDVCREFQFRSRFAVGFGLEVYARQLKLTDVTLAELQLSAFG